jgi:hypothetical protein
MAEMTDLDAFKRRIQGYFDSDPGEPAGRLISDLWNALRKAHERARVADESGRFKIFTVAHVPPELHQPWLQHLRDFDTAHPECHFEVAVDAPPDQSISDMVEALKVEPALTFTKIFERKTEPE